MSITRDLRNYADELTGKATVTVAELRTQAEKAVNLQAVKAAVEPYLAQAKDYTHSVTDRAGGLVGTVTSDKRVARLVTTAEALTGAVAETVQVKIVKPVRSLTGLGTKPATRPTAQPAPSTAAKPAAKATTGKPATKPATTSAGKPAAKATTGKPAARKAPAKKATER
jgi:hypothetical protein